MKVLTERAKPATNPAASAIPKTAQAGPALSSRTLTPWLVVVLVVVLFSGGLFGYDQGVISGALHGIKATFSLSSLLVEVVTSWVTLGALLGLARRRRTGATGSAASARCCSRARCSRWAPSCRRWHPIRSCWSWGG